VRRRGADDGIGVLEVPMQDGARRANRFGLISSFVGTMVGVVVFSPPVNADDDLFAPPLPPIVTGATVDTQATIVVDPATAPAVSAPTPPPVVSSGALRKPTLWPSGQWGVQWYPDANPPVVKVEERTFGLKTVAMLDNHGRYWILDGTRTPYVLEQVGGWPGTAPTTNLPPNQSDFFTRYN
jgi:hypothetical protein